jgi:putative thioredoxin
MGYSILVNSDNFATEVLQKSFEHPVLIDFFAVWCGPCQMLKPILEKMAQEYDLIVAKVNTDENPQLAHEYGIEGIPDVKLMKNGEIVDQFVGVLPEPELRAFLSHHHITSKLEEGLRLIQSYRLEGNVEKVQGEFTKLLEMYPQNSALTVEAAQFLIEVDQLEPATQLLDSIQADNKQYYANAQALKQMVFLKKESQNLNPENVLDSLFSKAANLTFEGEYKAALETFLEIIQEDRHYKNDGARKAIVAIFELLGDDHPLTKEYRKQLMMALY